MMADIYRYAGCTFSGIDIIPGITHSNNSTVSKHCKVPQVVSTLSQVF